MTNRVPQRSVFTAERYAPAPAPAATVPPLSGGAADFIDALAALRAQIRADVEAVVDARLRGEAVPPLEPAAHAPPPADAAPKPDAPISASGMTPQAELDLIRREITDMSQSIERTKAEIKALYSSSAEQKRMDVMRDELGSVVRDTEVATGAILEAMEQIDETAQFVKTATKNPEIAQGADQILDQVVKVFETCNFQDLTGQRINKVVNTMKHIEERIRAIVSIWGAEDLAQYESGEVKGMDDLDRTLATTSDEMEKVSQDDIDKMFD